MHCVCILSVSKHQIDPMDTVVDIKIEAVTVVIIIVEIDNGKFLPIPVSGSTGGY